LNWAQPLDLNLLQKLLFYLAASRSFPGSLAIDTEPQLYYKFYKRYIMAMRFTNVEVVC